MAACLMYRKQEQKVNSTRVQQEQMKGPPFHSREEENTNTERRKTKEERCTTPLVSHLKQHTKSRTLEAVQATEYQRSSILYSQIL